MKGIFWLAVAGAVIAACGIVWYSLRKWKDKQLAEQQRIASFIAATAGPKLVEAAAPVRATPVAGDKVLPQKLLFEAAHKAGEAGEPALAIQLYARLLARYPETAFAAQAHAAVESEKKKLKT
jgi:hypothetical protein